MYNGNLTETFFEAFGLEVSSFDLYSDQDAEGMAFMDRIKRAIRKREAEKRKRKR